MKNEELFDLLEQVDNKYIEEAVLDDFDDETRPVAVRAGKTRFTLLKTALPIAACLAVVIGTGAVVSHVNKLEQSKKSEQSQEELIDPKAFIQVDFTDKDYEAIYDSNTIYLDFETDEIERNFIAECISIVTDESGLIAQNETTWTVRKLFLGYDIRDDYLIYPQIDGKTVPGVGVRVFQKMRGYSSKFGETFDVRDLGAFAKSCESFDPDLLFNYPNFGGTAYYYYYETTEGSVTKQSIQKVFHNLETGNIIDIPRYQKITHGDDVKFYSNGESISEDKFTSIWNRFAHIPKIYWQVTEEEVDECKELLKANHGIAADWNGQCGIAELDLNFDGTSEILLSPLHKDVYGVYVYGRTNSGFEEIGSFDTDTGTCQAEEVEIYYGTETFRYPYYPATKKTDYKDGLGGVAEFSINKIEFDDDGNLYTTEICAFGSEIVDDENHKWKDVYRVNGEDVTPEKLWKTWEIYEGTFIHID